MDTAWKSVIRFWDIIEGIEKTSDNLKKEEEENKNSIWPTEKKNKKKLLERYRKVIKKIILEK